MLWQAIVTGDSTTVDTGLSQGIDANLTTSDGVSALMLAASTGNDQTVKALLSRGANPNDATAKHRLTALMFAANACSRPAIDSLLAAHADAELKDSDNGSAADWAFRGCKDPNAAATLIQYLYEKGASIQPRGDAVGLLLAEGAPPPIESLLQAARSQFRSP
jgi:ankyrin repeat protein